jgi:hypothetical protein
MQDERKPRSGKDTAMPKRGKIVAKGEEGVRGY